MVNKHINVQCPIHKANLSKNDTDISSYPSKCGHQQEKKQLMMASK
jgi:hypothetical protein